MPRTASCRSCGWYFPCCRTMHVPHEKTYPGIPCQGNLLLSCSHSYEGQDEPSEVQLPFLQRRAYWHFAAVPASQSSQWDYPDSKHCYFPPGNCRSHHRHRSWALPGKTAAWQKQHASGAPSSDGSTASCLVLQYRNSRNNYSCSRRYCLPHLPHCAYNCRKQGHLK